MDRSTARDLQTIVRQFAGDVLEWSDELARDARALDGQPESAARLARMYRSLHKVKGTCGLAGLSDLEVIAHAAEALVSDLTQGRRAYSAAISRALRHAIAFIRASARDLHEGRPDRTAELAASFAYRLLALDGTVGGLLPIVRRMAEDAAARCDKRVHVHMMGKSTPIEPALARALETPLLHLVRNAVDHGIEAPADRASAGKLATGMIRLTASRDGERLHLAIADDGAGIDLEQVELAAASNPDIEGTHAGLGLVFAAGVTTSPKVTSVSGRGVGLDLVHHEIAALGGDVDVRSDRGLGTTFTLHVPTSRRSPRGPS